jgi:hypothetical protein
MFQGLFTGEKPKSQVKTGNKFAGIFDKKQTPQPIQATPYQEEKIGTPLAPQKVEAEVAKMPLDVQAEFMGKNPSIFSSPTVPKPKLSTRQGDVVTFSDYLGGGAYKVGKTPDELVKTERTNYGGVPTKKGFERADIFPVSLGGVNALKENITYETYPTIEKIKDKFAQMTGKNYVPQTKTDKYLMTEILPAYKSGKMSLREAQVKTTSYLRNEQEGLKQGVIENLPSAFLETAPKTIYDIAKGFISPLVSQGVTAYNIQEQIFNLGKSAITGKPVEDVMSKKRNIPLYGEAEPSFTGKENPVEFTKKVIANGAELAGYAIGGFETKAQAELIKTVGYKSLSKITQKEAIQFTKAYGTKVAANALGLGTLFGGAASLKENADLPTTAKNIAQSVAMIALMEITISPLLSFALKGKTGTVKEKVDKVVNDNKAIINETANKIKEINKPTEEVPRDLTKDEAMAEIEKLPIEAQKAMYAQMKAQDEKPKLPGLVSSDKQLKENIAEAKKNLEIYKKRGDTENAQAEIDYIKTRQDILDKRIAFDKAPTTPKIVPKQPPTEAITPEAGKVATSAKTSLIEEAKKYKSAEEFVKNNDFIFQGVKDGKQSNFWSTNIEMARKYAGKDGKINVAKFSDMPEDLKLGLTKQEYTSLKNPIISADKARQPNIITTLDNKSQLTEIWNKAQEKPVLPKVKPIKPALPKQPETKPSEPTYESTIKTSGLAKSVKSKAIRDKMIYGFDKTFSKLPDYDKNITAEKKTKATDFVLNNTEEAIKMAMEGKAPNGLFPEDVFVAVNEYATAIKDVELIRKLATESKLLNEATLMGQRIQTLSRLNPDSPFAKIKEVNDVLQKSAEAKHKGKTVEKVKSEMKTKLKEKVKVAKKQGLRDFILSIKC